MKVCVAGTGSWGIALARHLSGNGHTVSLWGPRSESVRWLAKAREDPRRLPGIRLPDAVTVEEDAGRALEGCGVLVTAVPSHAVRETARALRPHLPRGMFVVSATKGLEEGTLKRPTEVLAEELPAPSAALSGPSHAEEVARGVPTSVVAASADPRLAREVQALFHGAAFRVYTSPDVTGVELGGALKNVIAIAAGILDGLELGDNAKAALMTRGLHEIIRLARRQGARADTLSGLAGMGDLFVTCTSRHSRNRLLGEKIGRGKTPKEALAEMTMVAEGVRSARAAATLAARAGVEMPISRQVERVLFEGLPVEEAVRELLRRAAKVENEDSEWAVGQPNAS